MKCNDCPFIQVDGEIICLLNMNKIEAIYEDKECKILKKYREKQI